MFLLEKHMWSVEACSCKCTSKTKSMDIHCRSLPFTITRYHHYHLLKTFSSLQELLALIEILWYGLQACPGHLTLLAIARVRLWWSRDGCWISHPV